MASHIRIHPSTKIPFHSRAETIGWENTIILNLILVMGTKQIQCERGTLLSCNSSDEFTRLFLGYLKCTHTGSILRTKCIPQHTKL